MLLFSRTLFLRRHTHQHLLYVWSELFLVQPLAINHSIANMCPVLCVLFNRTNIFLKAHFCTIGPLSHINSAFSHPHKNNNTNHFLTDKKRFSKTSVKSCWTCKNNNNDGHALHLLLSLVDSIDLFTDSFEWVNTFLTLLASLSRFYSRNWSRMSASFI